MSQKKTVSPEKVSRRIRRTKRRRGKKLLVFLVVMAVIATVLYALSVTVFFKIKGIEVAGSSRYDSELISKMSNISMDENLILLDTDTVSENICKALPYIGTAKVERKFPDKVRITVAECKPDVAYDFKDGYVIAWGDKCLEYKTEKPEGLITINADFSSYTEGEAIDISSGAKEALNLIRTTAENVGVTDITYIDVKNISDLSIDCDAKLRLRLGTTESLEKKMNNAVSIIKTQRKKYGDNVEGVIDLRYLSNDSDLSYFTRESISSQTVEPAESKPTESNAASSQTSSNISQNVNSQ